MTAATPPPARTVIANARARLRAGLTRAWRGLFVETRLFGTIVVMTGLLVLLHVDSARQLREVIVIISLAGIIDRRLQRRPAYWFTLTGVLAANHLLLWATHDNHQYLLTYWCLALGTSQLRAGVLPVVAVNARWLIGLCFLFATCWKVASTEFLDGTFFHFTLLTDGRFARVADLVGGVPADITSANRAVLDRLVRLYGGDDVIRLEDAPRIATLARFLSVWTVSIEALLALVFLLPSRAGVAGARDAVLLVFMLTTYPIATVVGFGRLLAVMGIAQSGNRFGIERPLYLTLFLLLPVLRVPFAQVIRLAGW